MGKKRKRQAQDTPYVAPAAKKQHNESHPSNNNSSLLKAPQAPFVEDPKGAELKREFHLYGQLSSQDETERLGAADAIVSGLFGAEGVSEVVLQRHLERRLFRGLASGRKAARLGFSVVLTEVLSQLFGKEQSVKDRYHSLTFEKVMNILRAKTKPEGDLSGQEERDHAFGLLFGLQCFVRAKVLFVAGEERWEKVLVDVLQLAKKKSWMREECGWVIVEALEQMTQQQAETTLGNLQEAGLAASPEGVGVWLIARRRFRRMKFPSKPWGQNGNPLEYLSVLAKVLKESSINNRKENGELAQQSGNWHPQLHFAWDIVLDECLVSTKAGPGDSPSDHFIDLWKVVVDESLFSSSASAERKFWGFLIFQKAIKGVKDSPWLLGELFSQNFMRCLINHISKEDRFLHRAADKCLKSLLQEVEANHQLVETIVPRLVGDNGVYNFDQVTKTKTMDKLLSLLKADRACKVIGDLLSPVKEINTADSARDAELRRQMFGDYTLSIVRHINNADQTQDCAWARSHALLQLASLAYVKDEQFVPPVSEKTRVIFRNRLNSAFANLISHPNGFFYPCELLQNFKPSAVDMDEDIVAAEVKAQAVMEKLINKSEKVSEPERKPLEALATLYALVIFQLYNGEPDAILLLEELKLCYDKLIRRKDMPGSDSEASVVLVEILLSFMSKQSVLLRKVAQQVFTAFSGDVTEESLKILVDVLGHSESMKGQQELFDQENEEQDHVNKDDDDELASDVEVLEVNRSHEGSESDVTNDDDDTEDSSDEDVEDEDEDDVEAQKLDDALAKALGTHRADQDLEEESSDSDADMSDSEMMSLDLKLVEIFSQRKKQPNKKKEKKDARENIINFKSRVLDLLEIYFKEQAASPLAFDLILPILKLIRSTTAKQLSEKAHKVVAAFAKASKGLKVGNDGITFDKSQRLQILRDIHEEASRDPSHAFARAASTASLLVSTNLFRANRSNIKKIATVYRDSQASWLEGKMKMQASFFHDWVNWCQSHAC